jgi:tetratricopeptide (TPR) repeat protein
MHGTSDIRHEAVTRNIFTSTQVMVSEIHRNMVKDQEVNDTLVSDVRSLYPPPIATHHDLDSNQVSNPSYRWTHHLTPESSMPGERPPVPSRTFFGRDELIEKILNLAENLIPIALIGVGGIGKTSIALAILHHDRIKRRFGDNRRFIRCDQFPASSTHLVRRLSNVIGAGVENPDSLTPLREFLSSKKMMIVLDNAESILDPQGRDAQGIYAIVEELTGFDNICVCITSRISTTPPDCRHIDVPTLSMDAACDTFYRIHDSDGDRSDVVNGVLEQLDFHPLSITLLATVARQNKWDTVRLSREWEQRRTSVLQTQHNKSLAAAIELSLSSPLFRELGPDARALLGVVAFFPQGIDENNLEWLFPTISNRTDVFDKFCTLSLTYRSNGFVTMLAPLRDHLSPKDPKTSPLLCAAKKRYFIRMSVRINPNEPNFAETQWITSEDVNVEHLLDVFTTLDANSDSVWRACANFIEHLCWRKKRLTILKPKIEGLPDDHRFKPRSLFYLSRLFDSVGNHVERKQLLTYALKLYREQGSDRMAATTLMNLSDANRSIGLHEEGIQQAREALGVYERLGDAAGRARCLKFLASSLYTGKQFDDAEKAALRAINLQEEGQQHQISECHYVLGNIYSSKGDTKKAIHHFELAIGIASPSGWHDALFWNHYQLAEVFLDEGRFDDAQAHIKHAKLHTVDSTLHLGHAMELQAHVWYKQHRLEEAKSEALLAADAYKKLGFAEGVENCRRFLQEIGKELGTAVASGQSDFDCELPKILLFSACVNQPPF